LHFLNFSIANTTIFDSLTDVFRTLVSTIVWVFVPIKKKKKNTGLTQAASKKVNLID